MISKDQTRCAWFPKCPQNINNCKGKRKDLCKYFKHGIGDDEFIIEMLAEKKKMKNERDRERKKLQRQQKRQRST